jgi:AcrR family transcriptional regulator
MATTPRRRRRPAEELRTRLIAAARDLFLEKGYEATTTKEIARQAGVSEPRLFELYGNKAGIFDAALVAPFSEVVAEYASAWREDPPTTTVEERVVRFISGIYDFAEANRTVLLESLVRRVGDSSAQGDALQHLAGTLHDLDTVEHGLPMDTTVAVAATAGIALSLVLLEDMLFTPTVRRPERERVLKELSEIILYGALYRSQAPPSAGAAGSSP